MGEVRTLYDTLQGRVRPEDAAKMILGLRSADMLPSQAQMLRDRTRRYSLMGTDFAMPVAYRSTIDAVRAITGEELPGDDASPAQLAYVAQIAALAANDTETYGSHRRRKLARIAKRLHEAAEAQEAIWHTASLARVAKTGLASDIGWEAFRADVDTACFAAYMAAQMGRRSMFTSGPQARAFDEVAEMLLARAIQSPTCRWDVIAQVFPRADILGHTTPSFRFQLLGRALTIMGQAAAKLGDVAAESGIRRDRMIVTRGQDSSTWNAMAGAFNKARDIWIAVIQSMGLDHTLDQFCPGKVMRLMAADVALGLHGGAAHGDEAVWSVLPAPWEVMTGLKVCGRLQIVSSCMNHGVDPYTSGWAAARPRTTVAPVEMTPETVHGVVVRDPALAQVLRKAGAFGGR